MKIPFYVPFIGILASFALFFVVASIPDTTLLIMGVILFNLSGWLLVAKFFLSTVGFFSTVLNAK